MIRNNDVTILGGGLAGLSLALQLRQETPRAMITVIEKRKHPVPEAAFKVGESTVEAAAHYFGEILNLKDHIRSHQLPKLGLRFFFPSGDNSQIERRLELGGKRFAPCPSYQIDRGRFENYLADECLRRGIEFLQQASVEDVQINRRGPHRVDFTEGGTRQSIASRWVVDATGRRALLKRKLGLAKDSPHRANAVWFRFKKHLKIDDWSEDPAWRRDHAGPTARWYSTNHLMGQGYWVWLIPLASGSTSMGIVAAEPFHQLTDFNSTDKAIAWLEQHEPQCAGIVRTHLDQLQDFRAIKHYATECRQVFSPARWGITGEAGFFHDPFYSPGSDFIAFSNTFLTDLIRRDLAGRRFAMRARAYDRIFKRFYYGTLVAYRDQYVLFGNPVVMPVKILWDYLVYWSITCFLFMQDQMCRQMTYLRNLGGLKRLASINHYMQEFFLRWHAETETADAGGVIDISQMPIVRKFNRRLGRALSDRGFGARFAANADQLEALAQEIVEFSGLSIDPPARKRPDAEVIPQAFALALSPQQRLVEPMPVA